MKLKKLLLEHLQKDDFKGLFDDIDTTSNRLGGTVAEKNKRLTDILTGIAQIDFWKF